MHSLILMSTNSISYFGQLISQAACLIICKDQVCKVGHSRSADISGLALVSAGIWQWLRSYRPLHNLCLALGFQGACGYPWYLLYGPLVELPSLSVTIWLICYQSVPLMTCQILYCRSSWCASVSRYLAHSIHTAWSHPCRESGCNGF